MRIPFSKMKRNDTLWKNTITFSKWATLLAFAFRKTTFCRKTLRSNLLHIPHALIIIMIDII